MIVASTKTCDGTASCSLSRTATIRVGGRSVSLIVTIGIDEIFKEFEHGEGLIMECKMDRTKPLLSSWRKASMV